VVSQYLVLGDMKMVAAVTGVSYGIVRQWKIQPWWKELEAEIRASQNIKKDTKLEKIVDRSLDAVLDRIENGEFFYDQKSGEIKRKPANLRDVARVATDMISKQELLRGVVQEKQEANPLQMQDLLKQLAVTFAEMNKPKPEPIELVEVEDAVYSPVAEQTGEPGEDATLSSEMETEQPELQEEAEGRSTEESGPASSEEEPR
jgi:hypothetical protein